ncbi:MAG: chitobiase/beta-hexosaminidase C-terminal domain-containing protein [Terracidiphilus sp.]
MRAGHEMLAAILISGSLLCGCGSGGSSGGGNGGGGGGTTTPTAATPNITTSTSNGAQNGAVIASLASTTANSTIYYTMDGSTPTTTSQIYAAPILVASNITLNAIATAAGYTASSAATQAFAPNIASGTLVWSDEFANTGKPGLHRLVPAIPPIPMPIWAQTAICTSWPSSPPPAPPRTRRRASRHRACSASSMGASRQS